MSRFMSVFADGALSLSFVAPAMALLGFQTSEGEITGILGLSATSPVSLPAAAALLPAGLAALGIAARRRPG